VIKKNFILVEYYDELWKCFLGEVWNHFVNHWYKCCYMCRVISLNWNYLVRVSVHFRPDATENGKSSIEWEGRERSWRPNKRKIF